MQRFDAHTCIRDAARIFEEALPASQRKELGQFFTGMPLGRLLAHLAVDKETRCLIDPMAGSGDLLDAAHEAAIDVGATVQRLDAIEVDEATAAVCDKRISGICEGQNAMPCVVQGDAFSTGTLSAVQGSGYDLVITNPPYVRYQSLNGRAESVRHGLSAIVEYHLSGPAQDVWKALAEGYSGLADLSIPAWLLSALLVRPGGRLALVVPATWRSRAYADVIRYLMLRAFKLELIVEDTQPGWFSDALVRTHLVVARRLPEDQVSMPLCERLIWPDALWVQVAPESAAAQSLVGDAFPGGRSEKDFALWCRAADRSDIAGISARRFSLEDEWRTLREQTAGRSWIKVLEPSARNLPLFAQVDRATAVVPEVLRDLLPATFDREILQGLDDAGIRTGQGLRTGCNRFFYVKLIKESADGYCRVETDPALSERFLSVPANALRPVLHRQSDLEAWRNSLIPAKRVLDLRCMVLPEDMDATYKARQSKRTQSKSLPYVMPAELAAYVRAAGKTSIGNGKNARSIADLSAVRTNARPARGGALPRFWYMLPDFTQRHLPQVFVPRIIHETPQVYANIEPPILIDANFSTFWADQDDWTPAALVALLNSAWCRAIMEAAGTQLGGGALKLEAVHLRKMPVPQIERWMVKSLDQAGQCEGVAQCQQQADRIVLRALLSGNPSEIELDTFAQSLDERRAMLSIARQRGAA